MDRNEHEMNESAATIWSAVDLKHLTPEAFAAMGGPKLVYIRDILAGDLAREMGSEINLPADQRLYAVHAANGERMAVVDNRDVAFAGARQHDLEPVSTH